MTQNITIPSVDTIRTMIADLETTSHKVLEQYDRHVHQDPMDPEAQERAETIREFRSLLERWDNQFASTFTHQSPDNRDHHVRYIGENHRTSPYGVNVTIRGPQGVTQAPLNPRLDLREHSPTGFGWGYEGSGAAQLALAILAHHTQDEQYALAHYQDFKHDVISHLPWTAPWAIDEEQLNGWTRDHQITPSEQLEIALS